MMSRRLLGATLLVALITVASCDFCNDVSIGSTNGRETWRAAVVPPNVQEYDIEVQPVCPEEDIIGLNANGCNEYHWTLSITSKTTIHVLRVESPDEIYVKLTVYCNFSHAEETEEANHGFYRDFDFKQNVPKSKRKIDSVDKSFDKNSSDSKISKNYKSEYKTSKIVVKDKNFKPNVYYNPRRIRSVNLQKQIMSEDLKNETPEDNTTKSRNADNAIIGNQPLKQEKSIKPFKVTKIEKINKKADKKNNKNLQKRIKAKAK